MFNFVAVHSISMDAKAFISHMQRNANADADIIEDFLHLFAEIITEQCGERNAVALPGFGTFEGIKHDEKIIEDLDSGHKMLLPPSVELSFKTSGMLRKKIKEVKS